MICSLALAQRMLENAFPNPTIFPSRKQIKNPITLIIVFLKNMIQDSLAYKLASLKASQGVVSV